MRTIKPEELEDLKKHLLEKPFKYEEVYNEVLDHYATAYECSDQTFCQVISEMDEQFPDRKISEINTRYFNDLRKSLRKNHGTIFMGHFRWPQLVYTIIAAAVLMLLSPYLMTSKGLVFSVFVFLTVIPAIIGLYLYFYWAVRRLRGKTKLKNAHAELFGVAFGFSVTYIQLPQLCRLFDEEFNLLMYNSVLTTGVLFVALILFQTSMTMILKRIKPAIL
ncbi:hypothetical protein [Marinoscillum pacificum]|uniref:hypothetical protein n=1 Tax=Marinoscillum pacificum TaxID=392723 RepID=UPI0021586150|nr:hypothetical protein [Marinoscillum pacificum]